DAVSKRSFFLLLGQEGGTHSVCPKQKDSMLWGAAAQLTRIFSSRSAVRIKQSSGLTACITGARKERAARLGLPGIKSLMEAGSLQPGCQEAAAFEDRPGWLPCPPAPPSNHWPSSSLPRWSLAASSPHSSALGQASRARPGHSYSSVSRPQHIQAPHSHFHPPQACFILLPNTRVASSPSCPMCPHSQLSPSPSEVPLNNAPHLPLFLTVPAVSNPALPPGLWAWALWSSRSL
ncbi:hypothetical protein P7K49_032542, partial [Saguinus oedipus]